MSIQKKVVQHFAQQFRYEPTGVFHGPGRVNIIGDHTDYNGGFVLPAAINFGTDIAAASRKDRMVRVVALDCDEQTLEFNLDNIQFDHINMWVNYVAGSLQAFMSKYPNIEGADLVVAGNVPLGAGLSSSASFEIALVKTFADLNEIPLDGVEAALMGQEAENNFVGCNCGIMDQLVSSLGKEGHAMLLDCRTLTFRDAMLPSNLEVVIINSNVKRGLVDSEYNTRRAQCEAVAKTLNKSALRDISMEMLTRYENEIDPISFRRARHVITENERTIAAFEAMNSGDIPQLSLLMKRSHESLRDDFEVTTKELDGIVDIVHNVIGENGGVRMTGGGFGGCVVALVPTPLLDEVFTAINTQYPRKFALQPDIYVCRPSVGAFRVN